MARPAHQLSAAAEAAAETAEAALAAASAELRRAVASARALSADGVPTRRVAALLGTTHGAVGADGDRTLLLALGRRAALGAAETAEA